MLGGDLAHVGALRQRLGQGEAGQHRAVDRVRLICPGEDLGPA